MQVIRLNTKTIRQVHPKTPVVMALGFFDGVHRGHQAVLARARQIANDRQVPLAVMTFSRHASRVFETQPTTDFRYLNTISQKVALLQKNQVDLVYLVDFTRDFAAISPQDFVDTYLLGLNVCGVVGGFDYTFGRGGHTLLSQMAQYSHDRFTTTVVAEHDAEHRKIGSTAIRHLIRVGHVQRANALLGHPYALAGQLVPVSGNQFCFKLASRLQQRPPVGTYRCQVKTAQGIYPATLMLTPTVVRVTAPQLRVATQAGEVAILGQSLPWRPWRHGQRPVIAAWAI